MAMRKVEAQRDIIAEAPQVWEVLVDLPRAPKILRSVDAVDLSGFGGLQPGAAWGETRREIGKVENNYVHVLAIDPMKSLLVQFDDAGTSYKSLYSLIPSSLGIRLRIEVTWDSGAGFAGLKGLVAKAPVRATKSVLEQDLADYARAAEDKVRR